MTRLHLPGSHVIPAIAGRTRRRYRAIGCGYTWPASARTRPFLPFQRLGGTSTSPGAGLGLTLSRGLTEAMGGRLDPHETPGGGLTMVISLPVGRRTARATVPELIGVDPAEHA